MRLINKFISVSVLLMCFVSAAITVKAVPDDDYEQNDSISQAYTGLPADTWLSDHSGLGIHNDDDWFRIAVTNSGFRRVKVECLHSVADGDIDLALFDADNRDLKMVWTYTDNEYLEFVVAQTGTYYIRVFAGDEKANGNSYDLCWHALPVDDAYEPNDILAEAFAGLPEGTWLSAVDGPGWQCDDDWYRVSVTNPACRRLVVDCTFSHLEGDINIELYDKDQTRLADSKTTTDNEKIDCILPSTGDYYVFVCFDDAGNAYDLCWNTHPYTPPTLSFISVNGPDSVEENSSADYTCTAHFSDSSTQDVTSETTWGENSSYTTIDSSGTLSAGSVLTDQSVTVTAIYEGQSAAKTVTIADIPPVLTSVSISGADEVWASSDSQYTCTAYYSDGSSVDVTALAFWSENSIYTEISSSGLLTAFSVVVDEALTVFASYNGFSSSKGITVKCSFIYYSDWIWQQQVPENMMAHEDDPAGDGVPNLLKYACKLPAMEDCSTTNLMTVLIDPAAETYSIHYRVRKVAVDADVFPIWSSSLVSPLSEWNLAVRVDNGEDAEFRYYKASIPLGSRGFMSLRAVSAGVM